MFRTVDSEDTSRSTTPSRGSESPTSYEPQAEGTPVKKQHHREITQNMIFKELFFVIALALTTYGALHNSPARVSKLPQAVRFFSSDSPVVDWYKGQLTQALAAVNRAEISFVMYYAPWDAECQHVRNEFENAARLLSDKVYFSAINCWNPGSECRLQHNKLPSWPIIMAYTVTSRGVLYKGPRDAQSMINFLELIMRPLRRVADTEDLVSLLSICDAVAVGFTPLAESSQHYNVWYHTALKAREFDVIGEICFAAVTSEELALDLGVEGTPTARLMLWNDTKDFPYDVNSWNSTVLLSWVLENFAQPVARVIPMWKKAFSFERYVDGNPILMLFTPLNPMYEQIPNYALLREVAMEYNNCNNSETKQWSTELIKLQHVQRLLHQQRDMRRYCNEYKFKKPLPVQRVFKKVVSSQYPWHNSTQKNQKPGLFSSLNKRGMVLSKMMQGSDDDGLSNIGFMEECSSILFPAEKDFYSYYEQCLSYEDGWTTEEALEDMPSSMLPLEDDLLSPENLIQENVKHICKLMEFASSVNPPINPVNDEENVTQITGLSCSMNFSLHFIAVDSMRNYHFAESLGIDIANKKDRTAVVILDSKHESQHILSEDYSARSLRQFIYNFTNKSLKRSLRSHVADAEHTHYFSSNTSEDSEYNITIMDLTTRTFRRAINTPGQLTIVAVCGGACASHVSLALASGARLLRACGVAAAPARVDAAKHDLPWHLTPPAHPALLLFPPDRGRESALTAPPGRHRVTGGLVVSLALRALGAPAHLRVRLELCRRGKSSIEKRRCLFEVKEHVTSLVGRNLKYLRRATDATLRRALLNRIVDLHTVHFYMDLIKISDLLKPSENNNRLLNSLTNLEKHWDIKSLLLNKTTVS